MRANIRRCFLEDTLGQAANVQPTACIGIAAILAVFILTFATAPKAGAHDAGHPLPSGTAGRQMRETFPLHEQRPPELRLFSRRS
jgi:hypothetical protein